jgi:hypothetical protein
MQDNINQRNKNKNRNGKWVVYQDNGQIFYIAFYVDGERFGYFEYNYNNKIRKLYYAR